MPAVSNDPAQAVASGPKRRRHKRQNTIQPAMAQADSGLIIKIVLHDAIAIAQNGCSYGWAAQVFKCFAEHGKSSPLVASAPVEVQPGRL